jgi:hypothetical protein
MGCADTTHDGVAIWKSVPVHSGFLLRFIGPSPFGCDGRTILHAARRNAMGKTVPALTSQEALPQPSVQAPRTRKLDSWSDWPAARRQPRLAIPREGSALPLLVPSSPLQDQEEPVAGGIDRPPSGEPLQPTPQGWVDHGDKSVQVPLPLDMREALALPRHQVVHPERHQLADPQTGVPQHSDDELVAFRGGRVLQAIDLLPAQDVLTGRPSFGRLTLPSGTAALTPYSGSRAHSTIWLTTRT